MLESVHLGGGELGGDRGALVPDGGIGGHLGHRCLEGQGPAAGDELAQGLRDEPVQVGGGLEKIHHGDTEGTEEIGLTLVNVTVMTISGLAGWGGFA